jgi:hypothetical protein
MNVLVVERISSSLALADRLAADGWTTIAAVNGSAALARLETCDDVSVIVTDDEATAAMLRERARLPIVACTSKAAARGILGEMHALIAGDEPLEDAPAVQARLAIDATAHRRLLVRFAAVVARTIETLRPGACVSTDESLVALGEAALLVGARRVTTALGRLWAADADAQDDAVRGLERELHRVTDAIGAVV